MKEENLLPMVLLMALWTVCLHAACATPNNTGFSGGYKINT
jgi:hypothetical protein